MQCQLWAKNPFQEYLIHCCALHIKYIKLSIHIKYEIKVQANDTSFVDENVWRIWWKCSS